MGLEAHVTRDLGELKGNLPIRNYAMNAHLFHI